MMFACQNVWKNLYYNLGDFPLGGKAQNLFGCANISYIKETFLNYSIFSFLWMQPFSLSSIIVNRLCFGKDFYT